MNMKVSAKTLLVLLPLLTARAADLSGPAAEARRLKGGRKKNVRVWVQYKDTTDHDSCLKSLTTKLMATSGASEGVAKTFLVPDDDNPRSAKSSTNASIPLQVHHDFFPSGLKSVAMTVSKEMLPSLKSDPNVLEISKDVKRYPIRTVARKRSSEKHLLSTHRSLAEYLPYGVSMVQADQAWAQGYYGQNVTVCVIDTGLDLGHPEFRTTGWKGVSTGAGAWNVDGYGHGTHVTGTIAARNDGQGVVGVAPKATIVTIRVFNSNGDWAYASSVAKAALTCHQRGAKVINMSIGGGDYSAAERDTFKNLLAQGVVSVAAAGNGGTTAYSYPASYASIVSVAAINVNKRLASFSQRNNRVDLAAPGVDVLSTVPRAQKQNPYDYYSGTSMATPHVAGVAALLFSKNASATAISVVNAMTASAANLGAAGYDNSFGYGLVSAVPALNMV